MMTGARACIAALLVAMAPRPAPGADRAPSRPRCASRYADTLATLEPAARERESRPAADWVYCLRATAVYEHIAYGRGGKVVREYSTKVRHGTGFAYRRLGGEWLVATNQHVVAFPDVTADGQDLEGVPAGSRLVHVELRIVTSESAPDSPDQAALRVVSTDGALDLAILATPAPLALVPYRIGRSADLRVGNAVLVRGYPLGAFAASNAGRVIGLGQRDLERGWDHEDFAVDALLNLGSSGSPVLAVSCETGEPEVVGVYHAGYRGAQGMNVVVAIDQLRARLDDPRPRPVAVEPPEPRADPAEARAAVLRAPVLFPFGRRTVRAERDGDRVRFSVLDESFPLSARIELAIVDAGAAAPGRAAELRDALWLQLERVLRYRDAEAGRDPLRAPAMRERITARIREDAEDQERLLMAARVGADGFERLTRRVRGPAERGPTGASDPPPTGGIEIVLDVL